MRMETSHVRSTRSRLTTEEHAHFLQNKRIYNLFYNYYSGIPMILFIVLYLVAVCTACVAYLTLALLGQIPASWEPIRIGLACCCTAGIGGVLYCVRAVYINRCVRDQWSARWGWWYLLRPFASFICGGVSYLFLKAGLLVLESKTVGEASEIGFYALAFIAGLNVDKFVAKVENIAQAVWGIEKSRSAAMSDPPVSGQAAPTDRPESSTN
jgi:hypothetical protein